MKVPKENKPSPKATIALQKVTMQFFLQKDIITLTTLYVNLQFQLEGIDQYRIIMQIRFREVLQAPKFKKDNNCKDYTKWKNLKLKDVTFNLVQWSALQMEIDLVFKSYDYESKAKVL